MARQGRWGGIVNRHEAYEAPKIGLVGAVSRRSPRDAAVGSGVQVHEPRRGVVWSWAKEHVHQLTARLI